MAELDCGRRTPSVRPCLFSYNVVLIFIGRTYFVAFCILIQIQLVYDIPTPILPYELHALLPSSEEEWRAESFEKWWMLKMSSTRPPTPPFEETFRYLFDKKTEPEFKQLYSEFGGYIMIWAVLGVIMGTHRLARLNFHTSTVNIDFETLAYALETWRRLWEADPKSRCIEPAALSSTISFNASAIYRAACARKVKDLAGYGSDMN